MKIVMINVAFAVKEVDLLKAKLCLNNIMVTKIKHAFLKIMLRDIFLYLNFLSLQTKEICYLKFEEIKKIP